MRYLTPALLALCASAAHAQTQAEAEVLPRIIDSVCVDVVEATHGCETFVLLRSETEPDAADLVIFSDARAQDPQQILTVARNLSFNGPFFGQTPELEQADSGGVNVLEEQIAYGRTPWFQTLTLGHDGDTFVITHFAYSTYDRASGGDFSCTINTVEGDWTASGIRDVEGSDTPSYDVTQTGQLEGGAWPLSGWSSIQGLPPVCEVAVSDWFQASRD